MILYSGKYDKGTLTAIKEDILINQFLFQMQLELAVKMSFFLFFFQSLILNAFSKERHFQSRVVTKSCGE